MTSINGGFMRKIFLILLFLLFGFFKCLPVASWACACGCGIFDVGTNSMFPSSAGGAVFEEYDFMMQKHNWHQNGKAPEGDNSDKAIRSSFMTTGIEYMFDRRWG